MSRIALIICLAATTLAACSGGRIREHIPFVYKLDVQQGNVVKQDMLARLKPGMDKKKVRFVMGTPLITDAFHQERWDYVYSFQPGGGDRTTRRISLYFENELLARIQGDVTSAQGPLAVEKRLNTTVSVPAQTKTGLFSWFSKRPADDTTEQAKARENKPDKASSRKGIFGRVLDKSGDRDPPVYRDPTDPDQDGL